MNKPNKQKITVIIIFDLSTLCRPNSVPNRLVLSTLLVGDAHLWNTYGSFNLTSISFSKYDKRREN